MNTQTLTQWTQAEVLADLAGAERAARAFALGCLRRIGGAATKAAKRKKRGLAGFFYSQDDVLEAAAAVLGAWATACDGRKAVNTFARERLFAKALPRDDRFDSDGFLQDQDIPDDAPGLQDSLELNQQVAAWRARLDAAGADPARVTELERVGDDLTDLDNPRRSAGDHHRRDREHDSQTLRSLGRPDCTTRRGMEKARRRQRAALQRAFTLGVASLRARVTAFEAGIPAGAPPLPAEFRALPQGTQGDLLDGWLLHQEGGAA